MTKLLRFITVTVTLLLLTLMVMGQISGPDPQSWYRDITQPIISGGLWRLRFHGGMFNLDVNTSSSGDFSSYNTFWTVMASGLSTVSTSLVNLVTPQVTLNGSVSGTATWMMPFQGNSYKKFIMYFNNITDAGGSINFPVPFTFTPMLRGQRGGANLFTPWGTVTTTQVTWTSLSGASGYLEAEGF